MPVTSASADLKPLLTSLGACTNAHIHIDIQIDRHIPITSVKRKRGEAERGRQTDRQTERDRVRRTNRDTDSGRQREGDLVR